MSAPILTPAAPFKVAELWRVAYRPLYYMVGERMLLVMFAHGITDIYGKTRYLQKRLGGKTVWVSRQIAGMRSDPAQDILACCLHTLVKLWGLRRRTDNVIVMCVHAATTHTLPEKIKKILPGVRVVSYMYDFMDLFVPPEQKKIWAEYHGGTTRSEFEYQAMEQIRRGEVIDGLLYKDFGPDWNYVEECPVPKLWMPQSVPSNLYQPIPPPDVADSFLFIGTIVPKFSHDRPSQLFADIMMEDIFDEVNQTSGYPIHAYVLNPHEDVLAEYQQRFAGRNVHVLRGDALDKLLPRVAGRYKWGWMMYHFPQPMVLPMVKISIPTKFWTYLAAGVPPVVSEEFEAVAKIVRRFRCGVVVSQDDIQRLPEVLDAYDWSELAANVAQTRRRFSLDAYMPKLVRLFKRVLARPAKILEPYRDEEAENIWRFVPEAVDAHPAAALPGGAVHLRSAGIRPARRDGADLGRRRDHARHQSHRR